MISIVLVCPTGLRQVSILTAVRAIPLNLSVQRTAGIEPALLLVDAYSPDVLLIDANASPEAVTYLLKEVKKRYPDITQVAMVDTTLHQQMYRDAGADFVLEDREFAHQLTEILLRIENLPDEDPEADPL